MEMRGTESPAETRLTGWAPREAYPILQLVSYASQSPRINRTQTCGATSLSAHIKPPDL